MQSIANIHFKQLILNVGILVIIYSNFGDARKHHLKLEVSQSKTSSHFNFMHLSYFNRLP